MNLQTDVLRKLNIGLIYLLLEPSNGAVRYVGQTTRNPQERLSQHLARERPTHKGNWIKALKRQGKQPVMLVYKTVPLCELDKAEIETIEHFRQLGCNLVNGTDGGYYGKPTKEVRKKLSVLAQGEKNGSSKLTEKMVNSIYLEYCDMGLTQKQLAKKYGVSKVTIHHILTGQTWNYLYSVLPNRIKRTIANNRNK